MFISYAHESDSHQQQVVRLWKLLRACGIDAKLDLPDAERPQDWPLWMGEQIREADRVLVIASTTYRERAEGRSRPTVGRGVQWEGRLIRNTLYFNPDKLARFVPVVLPGQTVAGIPDFLLCTTVYHVRDFTVTGAESLIRLLTAQPGYTEPPLGQIPVLAEHDPSVGTTRMPQDSYSSTRSALEQYHAVVLDRDEALERLMDGLRGAGAYHVIEAPAFAGKTAFMVELYRRLRAAGWPTAVFYVVDRYSNRGGHFLEAVIGQMLMILHSDEALCAVEDRPAQFARLWSAFATLGTAVRPAVLLVDGLDEQLVDDGISRLLPVHVSGHAHVVVATRSLPDFRDLVPPHHALATPAAIAVPLERSPHAEVRTDDAKRHLTSFLTSAPLSERIATLLLVAGSPLSQHDLADLLGLTVSEVNHHLRKIERCLLPLTTGIRQTGYQWAHAKYGEFVHDSTLPRQRAAEIHNILDWADRYAAENWPATTPPFLLHGLHHFLRTRHNVTDDRMADLVTLARRQRLLAAYGHDRVFLETIAFARDALPSTDSYSTRDLELLFRLDLHHLATISATPFLPGGLLRLLVLAGKADQAEGIAHATDAEYRASALAEVSEALTEIGAMERAREIVTGAWEFVTGPRRQLHRIEAMRDCARAARNAGTPVSRPPVEPDRREAGGDSQYVLCHWAGLMLECGDVASARAAVESLVDLARHGEPVGWVLAEAASYLSVLGDLDAATAVAKEAIGSFLTGSGGRVIGQVVRRLVLAARVDDAIEIAAAIENGANDVRATVHGALVEALVEAGHQERADDILARELELAASVPHETMRLIALAHIRATQAKIGNGDVESLGRLLDGFSKARDDLDLLDGMVTLGEAFLGAGHRDDADHIAQRTLALASYMSSPFWDDLLYKLALASIEIGDLDGARKLAQANSSKSKRARATRAVEIAETAAGKPMPSHDFANWPVMSRARLAVALAGAGHTVDTALDIANQVLRDTDTRQATLHVIEALFGAGGVVYTEAVLADVQPPDRRAEAFAKLSSLCRATDEPTADRLLDQAITVACRLGEPDSRVRTICAVLNVAGRLPKPTPGIARATAVAQRALTGSGDSWSIQLGSSIAMSLCGAGLTELAEPFAQQSYDAFADMRDNQTDDHDRYLLCRTLVRTGMPGRALQLAKGDSFLLNSVAAASIVEHDMCTAGTAVEQAVEHWQQSPSDDELADLVKTALDIGRIDLVQSLSEKLEDFDIYEFDVDEVADVFVHGMIMHGRGHEALALFRDFELHRWRAAALVAWSTAPTWPTEVRRRTVRLIGEIAVNSLTEATWLV